VDFGRFEVDPLTNQIQSLSCPDGKIAINGNFIDDTEDGAVKLLWSLVDPNVHSRWVFKIRNMSPTARNGYALRLMCVNPT
jgi:hypothetical protein